MSTPPTKMPEMPVPPPALSVEFGAKAEAAVCDRSCTVPVLSISAWPPEV